MHPVIGRGILALSGAGFPLTQAVIRRFGRTGALITEGVCAGLLIRDGAMIAAGAPGRLRRAPAVLLWLEFLAAAVAVGAGLRAARDEEAAARVTATRPDPGELLRRAAVGILFGLHTIRFRIYLQPDSGRR